MMQVETHSQCPGLVSALHPTPTTHTRVRVCLYNITNGALLYTA